MLAAGTLLGPASTTGAVLVLLGYLNASIGVFNLLPGHPLDGGSLLRATAWAMTGDAEGAMRISSRLGQALGLSMLVGGCSVRCPSRPGGRHQLAVARADRCLRPQRGPRRCDPRHRPHRAGRRPGRGPRAVGGVRRGRVSHTVATVVAAVARAGAPGVVLDEHGHPIGTFGPDQLADVPQGLWSHLTISESMRPVAGSVRHDELVLEVVAAFRGAREAVLAVTRAGRPIGTLAAEDVLAHVDEHGV
jgi:hypothetical protein